MDTPRRRGSRPLPCHGHARRCIAKLAEASAMASPTACYCAPSKLTEVDAQDDEARHGHADHPNVEDMDGYVGFLAALRCSYYKFVKELSKLCKQIVRHHLDSVTSPYAHICYENDYLTGVGSVANSTNRFNYFPGVTSFDLSDSGSVLEEAQENVPPKDQQHMTPPTKGNESKEILRESQLTVPETPSPDLPADIHGGKKR